MNIFPTLRHWLRNTAPVWQARNAGGRLRYWQERPALAAPEARAVASLRQDGITLAAVDEISPPGTFVELQSWARRRRELPEIEAAIRGRAEGKGPGPAGKKARFLVDLWGGPHELDLGNAFIRWSLSRPLLAIVSSYLGLVPRLREFFLEVTVPRRGLGDPIASQRWHQDPDDKKLVKVFLYLNDVDEGAGPFTYVKGSHASGRWRSAFPFDPDRGRHPDAAMVERLVPPEDRIVATGRAGTVIFCDTSGVHRGGYATMNERIMYTSVYTTPASRLPQRYTVPLAFEGQNLGRLARYAIRP